MLKGNFDRICLKVITLQTDSTDFGSKLVENYKYGNAFTETKTFNQPNAMHKKKLVSKNV